MEVNLIRRVVEELALLIGKFRKDVTADAKNKVWVKITAEANALGVSYRQVLTVKTKVRNLARDAKDKITYEKKERNRTGGEPAPKPISIAEENMINALKDTSSFKGIDDGMETSVGFPQQTETSESRPTQFSIQEPPSSVESTWIMRLEQVYQRNKETPYTEHTNLPVSAQIPPSFPNSSTQQPPKASENKRIKKPKKTAENVYELQCQVLESDLNRNQTQMELFKKQIEFYDLMKKNLENGCTESMLEALLR